jgi:3',5'-cyclic AMP phosphodiesterase CpdA
VSTASPGLVLAHLSDLHVTTPAPASPAELAGKRVLGWVAWRQHRRFQHHAFVLAALIDDLRRSGADHVGITGDLTQIGLAGEIEEAAGWLGRIGDASQVSLVPGNHDAYGPSRAPDPWAAWAPYMTSRDAAGLDVAAGAGADRFPFARRVGASLAVVGVSSARPTAPWLATGRIGAVQLARLESILRRLGEEGRSRVVLIPPPPVSAGQSRRRRLDDAAALRAVLARAGAELVLHGHTHRAAFDRVPGPGAPIPVVGVSSASCAGPRPERRARYHLYRLEAGCPGRVSISVRGFDPERGRFAQECEREL